MPSFKDPSLKSFRLTILQFGFALLAISLLNPNSSPAHQSAAQASVEDREITYQYFQQLVFQVNQTGGIAVLDNAEIYEELNRLIGTPKAATKSMQTLGYMNKIRTKLTDLFEKYEVPIEVLAMASARTGMYNRARQVECEECGIGLWGLTDQQAKTLGLSTGEGTREKPDLRLDVRKSTESILQYAKRTYPRHNNWVLVALESHFGAEGLLEAQAKAQSNDPWAIASTSPAAKKLMARWMASILIARQPDLLK